MDLFIDSDLAFEKRAMQVALSEDPNSWGQEVLQELYKQAPYISDFEPHVEMERVEGEQGYGLGHVALSNQSEMQGPTTPESQQAVGVRAVRIPIVIRDGMLEPFDLLITDDSKVQPLTEDRLRAAIFRPQAFDVTSRTPGDQSMVGQLYPPYRQSYGFGGGMGMSVGINKQSSALEDYLEKSASAMDDYLKADKHKHGRLGKKMASGDWTPGIFDDFIAKTASAIKEGSEPGSVLMAIAPTMNDSDIETFKRAISDKDIYPQLIKNAAAMTDAVDTILSAKDRKKTASFSLNSVTPSVIQLKRTNSGYQVKTASHKFWSPSVANLDRAQAVKALGEKIVLAADVNGAATMTEDGGVEEEGFDPESGMDSDTQEAGPIEESGLCKVITTDGQEIIGYALKDPIGVNGVHLPLTMFLNGSAFALQTDMVGVMLEEGDLDLPSSDQVGGMGLFATEVPEGIKATVPMTITGSMGGGEGEPVSYMANSYIGEPVVVSVHPMIHEVTVGGDNELLIPEGWTWVPLDQAKSVAIESQESSMGKRAAALRKFASVEVRGGNGSWSISGHPVDKVAHSQREMLGIDDAMFLLGALGVKQSYGVKKLAQAADGREPVQVRVGRHISLASDEVKEAFAKARENIAQLPQLQRVSLVKEASVLGDPQSVDAVLSLGFINPENITTFVGYLPVLEDAQYKLCDVLLASRLGSLIDTPPGAIEACVRNLENVLIGLKALAFQNN